MAVTAIGDYLARKDDERVGALYWAAAEVFLALNGEPLVVDTDAAFELVMEVASDELTEVDKIAEMLRRFA